MQRTARHHAGTRIEAMAISCLYACAFKMRNTGAARAGGGGDSDNTQEMATSVVAEGLTLRALCWAVSTGKPEVTSASVHES